MTKPTEVEIADAIDRLQKSSEADGVAVGPLNDGYIVVFERATLEKFLADCPDAPRFVIFVQTRELN